MSKLNIYETNWIDLVFENRNKEYGAYNLRQEDSKTSFFALLIGVSLLTVAISIPMVYNYLNPDDRISTVLPDLPPIVVTAFDPIIPIETQPEEPAAPLIETPAIEDIVPLTQLTNPIIVHAQDETPEVIASPIDLQNNPSTNNTTGTAGTDIGTATTGSGTTGTASASVPTNTIMNSAVLDKKPEFPGGISKFYTYVGNNFEKPELDIDRAIRVSVAFVIEKDGSMTDIKVLKDPGYGLGAEAIRVLKSLKTKWSPGIMDGKPVRTSYNLPITIQMN